MAEDVLKMSAMNIERLSTKLRAVSEELAKLEATQHEIIEELTSWQKIQALHRTASDSAPVSKPTVTPKEAAMDAVPEVAEADSQNNTDWVRAFIRKWSGRGVTVKEIRLAVSAAKLKVSETFVYTAVSKMKSRGEVEVRNKRYFATSKMPGGENQTLSLLSSVQ